MAPGIGPAVTFLSPMFDDPVDVGGVPAAVIVMAIGLALMLVGWLWMRRITDADDRGQENDDSWRSRDRVDVSSLRRQLIRGPKSASAVPGVPRPAGPTRGWLVTRTIMRISDVALLLVIWLVATMWSGADVSIGDDSPSVAGVPARIVLAAIAGCATVVGWVWIRRIASGEPEPESNDRFWRSRR